ncbi:hypothetical protein LUZ60_004330 [Juncus effusus]|nr:hypothetical protein LUZ60_004330 [Juncus effusus]
MARAWLVTSRGIAKKIKNTARFSNHQINEISSEANRECPNCNHLIDNSDVNLEWPGLPAGVKFDPTDLELIEHLEGKLGLGDKKSHSFIDEFIPTLEEEHGICYTHPENLPGIKHDGSSSHFFHRISNAYATGPRKRRKITSLPLPSSSSLVRWHKTGKTKPILDPVGAQRGWKKIMVLYKAGKRGTKPDKANWVMHQYHVGEEEDEKDGQVVVCKVIRQVNGGGGAKEKFEMDSVGPSSVGPSTPLTAAPQPPRQNKEEDCFESPDKDGEDLGDEKKENEDPVVCLKDEIGTAAWWAGESQATEDPDFSKLDRALHCNEVLDSFPLEPSLQFDFGLDAYGLVDFNNVDLGSPPDLQLTDLQFGSQESISSWLDRV